MAYTNFTAATAIDITTQMDGTGFYSATVPAEDINSSPTAAIPDDHPLWWTVTNTKYAEMSFFAQGTPEGVTFPAGHTINWPLLSFYTGTPGSLTGYPPGSEVIDVRQGAIAPFSFPIGLQLFIRVTVGQYNSEPYDPVDDPLIFQAVAGPQYAASAGSLLVPDFNSWPAVLIGTDSQIKQQANLAQCDFGAILDDGTIALIDNSSNPPDVKIYGPTGTLLYTQSGLTTGLTFQQIQGDGVNTFYVGGGIGVPATIKTISSGGVVGGTTYTLPANSANLRGMAPNRAETILYYTRFSESAIHAYDLIGLAALPDLAASLGGGYVASKDLFVMKTTGNILASYRASATDAKLILYSPAGAVLNTYVVPSGFNLDRTALGTDDPDSFWIWTFINGTADPVMARFFHYQTSDGALLESLDVPVYTDGLIDPTAPVNNPPRFGISNSCPLLIIREAFAAPAGASEQGGTTDLDYTTAVQITRRQRTVPHLSSEQKWIRYYEFQLDLETGQGLVTGQGSDPTIMLDYSDDGAHTFSNELWVNASALGTYKARAMWRRLGRSRDRVFRVTVSDPVPWHILAAYLTLEKGTS